MSDPFRTRYIDDMARQFRAAKKLADRALEQVSADAFFHSPDPESNSIAVIVKHMAGNLRSRWTDWLSTDGEKPDRARDGEFELTPSDTRSSLMSSWEAGWALVFGALSELSPEDLDRTVRIRGEPHSIEKALGRQLSHAAMHAGQIVYAAKLQLASEWRSLSIPRGESAEFNERMAQVYGADERD
jgi:hypothetical protein